MSQTELITRGELMHLLEKKRAGRTLKETAEELGVSFQFLAKVVSFEQAPGPRLAQALGYEQVTAYRRIPPRARKVQK